MDLGLTDKKALVIGASKGLGAAIAAGLAREGVRVTGTSREPDRVRAWADKETFPREIGARALDLADEASVRALSAELLEDGGVDVLVNNCGGPPPGMAATVGRREWETHFSAMCASVIDISTTFLGPMRERKWGRILTIASSGVVQPIDALVLSNGLRACLVGWSKTLAGEVGRDGVTVNVLLPGRIATSRLDELDGAAAKRTGCSREEIQSGACARIPLGRYGAPEEFADVTVFLASERASYVTGSCVRIDGGMIASI